MASNFGEFYEFLRGYGNDSCVLVAVNCHFRKRFAESMPAFEDLVHSTGNYKEKMVIKKKLNIYLRINLISINDYLNFFDYNNYNIEWSTWVVRIFGKEARCQ